MKQLIKTNNILNIAIILMPFLLLFPILFFPLDNDHAIYYRGGIAILNGGIPFVDIIDIKQPVWYYIFALIIKIFGQSEFAIRHFDYLFQVATFYSLYFISYRLSGKKSIGIFTAVIYAFGYVAINYSQSLQPENFSSIFIAWGIYWALKNRVTNKSAILAGVFFSLAASVKFTIGIIVLPTLFLFFWNKELTNKEKLVKIILFIISFAFILLASFFPLLKSGELAGFLEVKDFLSNYNSVLHIDSAFFKTASESIGAYLGDNLSLFILVSTTAGFALLSNNRNHIARYLTLSALFLLLSIIIERKFLPYHFTRLYVPIYIMSGFGIFNIIEYLKLVEGKKIFILSIIPFILFFSPLPRYVSILQPTEYYLFNRVKYDEYYQKPEINRLSQLKATKIISSRANLDPRKTMVVAVGCSEIYFFLHNENFSIFGQSQFFTSIFAPQSWIDKAYKECKKSDWIVVQNNDSAPILTGHNLSSLEWINSNNRFKSLLDSNFILDSQLEDLLIYRRKF